MQTYGDIAEEYAKRIREAQNSSLIKSAWVQKSVQTEIKVITMRLAVTGVFQELDGLVDGITRLPLSEEQKSNLLRIVDEKLDISEGSLEIVKKGSVLETLKLDDLVANLISQMQAE